MTIYEQIKANPELLTWARYSLRFNTRYEDAAIDFIGKLKFRHVDLTGMPSETWKAVAAVKAALKRIESDDRE